MSHAFLIAIKMTIRISRRRRKRMSIITIIETSANISEYSPATFYLILIVIQCLR